MALESKVRNDRLKMVSWYHGNDVEPANKTQTLNKSDPMLCDAVRAQQTNSKTRKEGSEWYAKSHFFQRLRSPRYNILRPNHISQCLARLN
jgi:hypothetical protein